MSDPETGPQLFALGSTFLKGVVNWSGLPPGDRGEIALAGRSNVGKSSLATRFIHEKFSEDYQSTLGALYYSKMIKIGDLNIKIQLWDTAG